VLPIIDFGQLTFGEPAYLWLLIVPALLFVLWTWRLAARRADARRLAHHRVLPVRERLALVGDFPFWLCLVLALASLIVALARPRGPAAVMRQAGIDLVILQDASASMRVKDVSGDRWQRAVRFLRVVGDALSWDSDRIAMAVFARIATPQIRLTKDPNTFFFFLDNLERQPPFRLEDVGTWDTNLELGLHWGLRLIERDEELHGKSPNAKVFIAISDGELWSGEVAKSLLVAKERGIPVYAVGVGTLGGGAMPKFKNEQGEDVDDPETPTRSRLDREGLQMIAEEGGGQYFELDRDGDRRIANTIIDAAHRRAPSIGITEEFEELYWYFLCFAAAVSGIGMLFLRERADLWIQLAGAVLVLIAVTSVLN
jgi:Ca-activated chloride channel family protein